MDLQRPTRTAWAILGGMCVFGLVALATALVLGPSIVGAAVASLGVALLIGSVLPTPFLVAEALHPRWCVAIERDHLVVPTSSFGFRPPAVIRRDELLDVAWFGGLHLETRTARLHLHARWFGNREPDGLVDRIARWRLGG